MRARHDSIVVMTDARGTQYPTAISRRRDRDRARRRRSPTARILRLLTAPFEILRGHRRGAREAAAHEARGRRRLRRLSEPAGDDRGVARAVSRPRSWRPNAVLGRVNRLRGRLCARDRGVVSAGAFRAEGHVEDRLHRQSRAARSASRLQARPTNADAPDGPLHLLVFGGSQGARALSEIVPAAIALLPAAMRARLDIVQQCRPEDIEAVRAAYAAMRREGGTGAVLQRSAGAHGEGASGHRALAAPARSASLTVIGRPAILIPLPFATGRQSDAQCRCARRCGRRLARGADATSRRRSSRSMLQTAFADAATISRSRAAAAHALGKARRRRASRRSRRTHWSGGA